MKILRLYLKNFKHIESGLGLREVSLDFRNNDKVINIFIGKMGSCKTVILGHLQPFHSFGTVDVRNQDGSIIEDEDGIKIIEYQKGMDHYEIEHVYTWNKNTHMVKSYIRKNGNEMNENGNQGSFKTIIEYEFGIEQNFLKLLRIGANVSNVIHMKSTERKVFIVSLQQDAEIYSFLYRKLNDEMRELNATTNILTNKLHHIGASNIIKMEEELEGIDDNYLSISNSHEKIKSDIYKLDAIISSILDNRNYDEYEKDYINKMEEVNNVKINLNSMSNKIEEFGKYPSIIEVSKTLGSLDKDIYHSNNEIEKLTTEYNEIELALSKLTDSKKIMGDDDHIKELQNTNRELMEELSEYEKELKNFNLDYSSNYIISVIADLNNINLLIDEIIQHDKDIIKKLYNSDSSVINWSKKQIEFLNFRKMKIQKEINNIKFSDKYDTPAKLYFPPFCPTKECPYYKTHPSTIKKQLRDDNIGVEKEVEILLDKAEEIDIQIYKFNDYPMLYSKINNLKQMWKKIIPIIKKMGSSNNERLIDVLTNFQYRNWFNYDKISYNLALVEKREKYYQLTENLNKIKNELALLNLTDRNSIDEEISKMEERMVNISKGIYSHTNNIKEVEIKIKDYNQIYLDLSELSILEKSFEDENKNKADLQNEISQMEINMDKIKDNVDLIKNYRIKEIDIKDKIQKLLLRKQELQSIINDIKYTVEDFNKVIEYKENLKYIINAVSPKEGIPLELIKMFLNNSKDVLNELVSDVFGDVIEILDFKITENEFKIPYSVNGVVVEDIEKASQGQQSVISIALSFALVRQSMFDYNIMLLDEVDAPLYKHDRQKFISILFKQLNAINAKQVFLISHNNSFDGHPVNIIMTTEEIIDKTDMNTVMKVY